MPNWVDNDDIAGYGTSVVRTSLSGAALALDVLRELDVVGAIDTADAADLSFVLSRINRVLDDWGAEWGTAYVQDVSTFTIVPALNPHTIGPTGATWALAQRPASIEAANLVVGTTRTPLMIVGVDDWMALSYPENTSTDPFALYYSPTFPLGSVYLYPVPSSANQIAIQYRGLLAQLTLTSSALLPPGYASALVLTTAEQAAPHFHAAWSAQQMREAAKARGRIAAANAKTPKLSSDAPGCTTGGKVGTGIGMGGGDYSSFNGAFD